jgi:hypothetical protein
MLIPLGILASSGGAAGSYELITTAYGTGSSGTISFTSIPAGYKHLQIRMVARSTGTSQNDLSIRFNNDTGANYSYHHMQGNGSNVIVGGNSSTSFGAYVGITSNSNNSAGIHEGAVIDILDYASTSKYKTTRSLFGDQGINRIGLIGGLWQSTSAITQADVIASSGNWTSTSRFSLYGIKG